MEKILKKPRFNILILVTIFSLLPSLLLNNNAISASEVPDSRPITNEAYLNKESLQPYGTVLQVDELKHWSPDKDPDAKYNKGAIPLKNRDMGPLVNPNASSEAKVMSLAMSNPRASQGKSQGGKGVNEYAFTFFQYIDTYNYWGGSSHEGIIAIPPPEHIDSAHINGVKATGTIFFPWGDPEFVGKAMTQFTEQDKDGNFIIADKLFEIADYYGFEGFFINQESSVSPELAEKLREMLVYIQNKKPEGFVMQWYDAMIQGGGISHQNGVNATNISMIQDGDKRLIDEFFMNFNWNKSRIDTSINTMIEAGRSPYDAYATWENFPYDKDPGRVQHLVDENGVIRTSIGLLAATETLVRAKDPDDFQNIQDPKLWVGPKSDPTDTHRDPNEFPGISSLVADRTPILGSNFVTHFTAGNGYNFYENGTVTKNEEWYNRSLTDVMPTWCWIVESNGPKLTPQIDYTDAYFAGTSLKVAGNLEAANPNHIKLYSSKLNINANSELSITYKTKKKTNNMKVGLNFGDTYEDKNFIFFDIKDGPANQWNTVTIDLSAHEGKIAKAISLQFASEIDVEDFEINVGRLAITDQSVKPETVKTATFDEIMFEDYAHAEARVYWDAVDKATLYSIHRVKADGTKEFIGATPNNAYYIDLFEKDGKESGFNFEITPISETGVKGEAKNLYFEWSIPENTSEFVDRTVRENYALNKPAYANIGNDSVSKLNDGIITSSKWLGDSHASESNPHIATIDLGEEKEISRWVVHHANAPGAGESPDMNTVDFKFKFAKDDGEPLLAGSAQDRKSRIDKLDFADADTVTNNKLDITDRNLDKPITARYIQLYVTNGDRSPWVATRVYEFEVYKDQYFARTKPINMQFVRATNNDGATDTVTVSNVQEGDTVYLYKDLTTETVLVEEVASDTGIVEFTNLDFGSDAGRIYYTVKSPVLLESIRRSVPFDAESGDKIAIPSKEDILLERSLKGNQLDFSQKFGVLTLKNLPEGVHAEIFEDEDQVFPILLSAPAVNGSIVQERIPLEDSEGKIYVRLIKEGLNSSDRFEIAYDSHISGDTSTLRNTIKKYSKLKEDNYISSSWETFDSAMIVGKEILEKESPTVEEILDARANIIDTAKNLEQKGNIRDLLSLYGKHKEKQEELYSKDSWGEFKTALDYAAQIIDKDDSLQQALDEAKTNLEEAVEKLVRAKMEEVALTIDKEALKINENVGLLTLRGQLNNGFHLDIDFENVALSSENPEIASVDKNGKVTPHKVGSTVIHAKVMIDDVAYDSNSVTVKVEIDISELEGLIEQAKEITNADSKYTDESFEALQTAIEDAALKLDSIKTGEDSANAIDDLQSVIDALEKVDAPEFDVSELKGLIKQAKEIINEDGKYTEESFATLQVAIVDAEENLDSIETEDDLKNAIDDLQSVIDALEEIEAPELDFTELKGLIKQAREIINEDGKYTEESFAALQVAIVEAEENLDSIETEDDLKNAIEVLQSVIDALEEVDVPKLDVSELEDLIQDARSHLTEAEKYTIESIDALAKAIDKAEAAIDEIKTESDLEQAISALQSAINELEIDVAELEKLIETAKSITNEDSNYTEKSFDALQAAIKEAESILASVETEEDLTNAIENLQAAINALEEAATPEIDVTELEKLIQRAKSIKNEDGKYTEESFSALQAAIEQAELNLEVVKTKDDLKFAINDLQSAIDGLTNALEIPTKQETDKNKDKETETAKDKNSETENGNTLPATATSMFKWIALGILLASLGIIFTFVSVRKKKQNI